MYLEHDACQQVLHLCRLDTVYCCNFQSHAAFGCWLCKLAKLLKSFSPSLEFQDLVATLVLATQL